MRLFTFLFIALLSLPSFAQNISGKAYYESKTTVDMDNWGGRQMSEEMKKQIAERMKSMLEKTYILTFNNNESIYKEEEKLEAGGGRGFGMFMSSYAPGAQYKNIEENKILEEREFFGREFLINDEFNELEWELTKESKHIGQYVAFKATAVKKVDENDFSMARRRNRDSDKDKKEGEDGDAEKEEMKEGDEDGEKAEGEEKEEDPFDEIEVPKQVIVTAWYTPMIPVGHGPGEYGGLPGLILEMNVHRTTVLCSKIVMNPKDADKIEAPTRGQKVTREEYNLIVKEKTEEMRENFRGRGRGRRSRG